MRLIRFWISRIYNSLFRVEQAKRTRSYLFKGATLTSTTRAPFLFSSIKISDDHHECNATPEFIKNVGTIVVKVFRVTEGILQTPNNPCILGASKVLHETAKKGMMSHMTGFGAAQDCRPADMYHTELLDALDKPFASFKFYYRSRGLSNLSLLL